jgi:hypothetical protein
MKMLKLTILLLLLILNGANSSSGQNQSKTYLETRKLLLEMERPHANKSLKKLFEEGDLRQADLIKALYDSDQKVSLNAQSVIKYLAEPKILTALDEWYEYRKTHTKEYWNSPVTLLTETKYLNGKNKDLAELVLKNLHNEKDTWAKLIAYNKTNKTALIEVVYGEIFTEGWHVVIRQENGKWRVLSNYLVWQS